MVKPMQCHSIISSLVVSPLILVLVSGACAPSPIAIKIGNVTLGNAQIARGAEVYVGDPPQPFAFLPQWPYNTSFIYGIDGRCSFSPRNYTKDGCATVRGGAYDALASESRRVPDSSAFPVENAAFPETSQIADILQLNDETALDDFPLGIALNDWGAQMYHPQAALGLGMNSTLLNNLKDSGKIASRAWSFFWGRDGGSRSSQLDGSLVLGGYDQAKLSGKGYVDSLQPSTSPCASQMQVAITDMILNLSNGTNVSIFPGSDSSTLPACIVPDYPVLMTLPLSPYVDNLFEITGGSGKEHERSYGINFWAMRYFADEKQFDGDLTIELESGLAVRIPNDQLVVPNIDIDPDTGERVTNYTNPDLVINAIQYNNINDMPQLGRQFLSAAYLMVNQDAGQFTLWVANPTVNEDLVAVDTDGSDITETCTSAVPDEGSATAGSDAGEPSSSSSVSSGTIAGAVVGGIGGSALVGALAFWFIKKRRSGNGSEKDMLMQSYAAAPSQQQPPGPKPGLQYELAVPPEELPPQSTGQSAPPPAELPLSVTRFELPSERYVS